MNGAILTVNGGSSSVKFAVFSVGDKKRVLSGQIERIGQGGAKLVVKLEGSKDERAVNATDHRQAARAIAGYLKEKLDPSSIKAIGHRVVHGGLHLLSDQLIDDKVLAQLRDAQPLDMTHLPLEIALIEEFQKSFPNLAEVACFDTAFHRDMPRVAQLLPIPRRYLDQGLRRFGFHGISYTYLLKRLREISPKEACGRVIFAHLGSGASMAAVRDGKPIETTMAFTATAGLVMGTRPGDLDPGLLVYLARTENLSPDQLDDFVSTQCGLKGVSATSSDMRDLIEKRATDPRAAEAVDLFCYTARKFIGALYATLGGLDTLIFSGGIGEHSAEIRTGICKPLDCLGIALDETANSAGADIISAKNSRVTLRIIPTDEELVIADTVSSLVRLS